MSPRRQPKNVAASVRTRLLDLARRRHVEFQLTYSEFSQSSPPSGYSIDLVFQVTPRGSC